MAMCGNTKMALCSIPLASLCIFTPTHLPLAHSTPILCGLKVLERSGKRGRPDSNAPADGTAMCGPFMWGGFPKIIITKKKKRNTTNFIKILLHA